MKLYTRKDFMIGVKEMIKDTNFKIVKLYERYNMEQPSQVSHSSFGLVDFTDKISGNSFTLDEAAIRTFIGGNK